MVAPLLRNTLVCERMYVNDGASTGEEWLDLINVLCCPTCADRYLVQIEGAPEEHSMSGWTERIEEITKAVAAEHEFGHPTCIFRLGNQ